MTTVDQAAYPRPGSSIRIAEKSYVLQEVKPALERLSTAAPGDVQKIAASQLELVILYHALALNQANRSFYWALIAAGVGLTFFVGSVGFFLFQQPQNAAVVSLISGSLIEVISAINFYLYRKTSEQLAGYFSSLDLTQRFLLANSICEGLENDSKQKVRSQLVRVIVGIKDNRDRLVSLALDETEKPKRPEGGVDA